MTRLRLAADAITVVVGVVLVGVLVVPHVLPERHANREPRIDATIGIDFGAAPRTLILVLQEGCPACAISMPFYRSVVERAPADVQIVVAAPEDNVGIDAYLTRHGVMPDAVVLVGRDGVPASSTPTLLLANSSGLVTHAWVGVLSPAFEEDVLAALFG